MSAIPDLARAYLLESAGVPPRRIDRPVPTPARGQVLVRNLATAVNFHDILNIMGVLPNPLWPRVPFSDNCGEIVAIGEDVAGWAPGDRVIANFFPDWIDGDPTAAYCASVFGDQLDGFLQDYTIVDARALVRAPTGLSAAEAATLCCAGLTAWRSVAEEARIGPGQIVVVQGTGGVSLFALQIAKMRGAEVILISSSEEKLAFGKTLGADHLLNYRADPAWDERVVEITDARGADLIVEIGGFDTMPRSLNAAKMNGHISIIGVRSGFGQPAPVPLEAVLIKNLILRGITVGSVRQLRDFVAAVDSHDLRPVIDRSFAFDEAQAGLSLMEAQGHIGKIAIDIAGG